MNPAPQKPLPARRGALFALRSVLTCILFTLFAAVGANAQTVSLTKSLAPGTPNPVPTGQDFEYIMGYTFSSTTADFYSAFVQDVLPPGLVFAGAFTPSAQVASVVTPPTGSGGTIRFNMISPLPAGSSGTLRFTVRFPSGTTPNGTQATNVVTGAGNSGSSGGPLISGTSAPVVITASATCSWLVTNTGPATAIFGQNVTNVITLNRPSTTLGSLNILSGTLTDTLPVGVLPADVISSSGGTLSGTGLAGNPVVISWNVPATNAAGVAGSAVLSRTVVLNYNVARFANPQTVTGTAVANLNLVGGTPCSPSQPLITTLSATPGATVGKGGSAATVPLLTPFYWTVSAVSTGNVPVEAFTLNDPLPQNFALTSLRLPTVTNAPGGNFISVQYATSADATLQAWPGSPFPAGTTTLPVSALSLSPGVYVSRVQFEMGTVATNFGINSAIRFNGNLIPTGWGAPPNTITNGNTVTNIVTLTGIYNGAPAFPPKTATNIVTNLTTPSGSVAKNRSISAVPTNTPFNWSVSAASTGNVALDNFTLNDPLPQNFALSSVQLPTVNNGPGGNFIAVQYATSANATLQTWPGSPYAAGATLPVSALSLSPGVYVSRVQFGMGTVAANFSINSAIIFNGTLIPTGWDAPPNTLVPGYVLTNVATFTAQFNGGAAFAPLSATNSVTNVAPVVAINVTKNRSTSSVALGGQPFNWTLVGTNMGNVALDNFILNDPLPENFVLSSIQLPTVFNPPTNANFIVVKYATTANPTLLNWPGSPFPATTTNLSVCALGLPAGVYVTRVQFEFGTVPVNFGINSPIVLTGSLLSTGWSTGLVLTNSASVTNTDFLSASYYTINTNRSYSTNLTVAPPAASYSSTKTSSTGSVIPDIQSFTWSLTATNRGSVPLDNFVMNDPLPQNFVLSSVQLAPVTPATNTALCSPASVAVSYATTVNPTLTAWPNSPYIAATTNLPVSALGLAPGVYVTRVQFNFGTVPVGFATLSPILLNGWLTSTGWLNGRVLTPGNTVTNIETLSAFTNSVPLSPTNATNIVTVAARTPNATLTKSSSMTPISPYTDVFYWSLGAVGTGNAPLNNFTINDPLPQNFALSSVQLPTATNAAGVTVTVKYATSLNPALQTWPGGPFALGTTVLPVSALGLQAGEHVSQVQFGFATVATNFGINSAIRLTGTLIPVGWGTPPNTIVTGSSVTNIGGLTADYNGVLAVNKTASSIIGVSASADATITKGRQGASTTVGASFYWTVTAANTGDVPLNSFVIDDPMPGNFALSSIRYSPVSNGPGGNFINLRYATTANSTLQQWPGSPFANPAGNTTVNAPTLPAGVYVTRVQFDFGTAPVAFGLNTPYRLIGTFISPGWDSPTNTITASRSITNVATLTATNAGVQAFPPKPSPSDTTVAPLSVQPQTTKAIISAGSPVPGSVITYRVETINGSGSGTSMVNPVVMDLLSTNLQYVAGSLVMLTGAANNSANATTPTLEILPNFNGTNGTLLRWTYTNIFAVNTTNAITFQARVVSGVPAGVSIANTSYVWANPVIQWGSVTYPNPSPADTKELNGNTNTTEIFGQSTTSSTVTVGVTASLQSSKFVQGALDTTYSRYPLFGFTVPGGAVDYRIGVFNDGSVAVTNIVLLDLLPSVGDVGVIDPQPRLSAWTPLLTGPINVLVNGAAVPGTVVEYSTAANPCRPDFVPTGPVGCTAPGWTTSLPSPLSATRAFRVTFPPAYQLAAGASMTIDIPMVAPMSFIPGSISWNSFAYRATPTAAGLPELLAEPIKVGVSAIPPYSIGDYVWLDENSDGYQDAGEPGIPNVRVNFYATSGTLIASTLTDASGHYLFSGLIQEAGYVRVEATTLPSGMTQTPPSTLTNANFGNQDQTTGPGDYGYFVRVLTGIPNLTADFGYNWNPAVDVLQPTASPTAALGDRVWLDFNGNGRQDPDELGVRGATVQLFTAGPDGLFDTADDLPGASRTTDANGNYMFDGLAPGAYVVKVVSDTGANFPILGASYTLTGDPDTFGLPTPGDNATTVPIVLGPGDVFLNADFGYQPGLGVTLGTIGDRVWLDINSSSNSVPDSPSELGLAGVTVSLIRDTNGNGLWDNGEPIVATTSTDATGNYLFRGLPLSDEGDGVPGDADYLVWVNDTAYNLANLVPTYDNSGSVNGLGHGVLSPGSPHDLTVDFSYKPMTQPAAPAVTTAVLGDRIWFDANRDGLLNNGESGIPGILMELLDAVGNVIFLAVTDPSGYYYFAGLDPSATYGVRVAAANFLDGEPLAGMVNTFDPDGGLPDRATVNFAVNDGLNDPDGTRNFINLGQDFGYAAPAGPSGSIGNQFWVDANANGIRDPLGADGIPGTDDDEPALAGVTVDLYRDLNINDRVDPGEPLIATTLTDANGQYLFTGLPLMDGLYDRQVYAADPDAFYVVNVSDRTGVLMGWWHSLGNQSQTSNDTSKLDPYGVTLTDTVPAVMTADFGYYVEPAAVGNFVWLDTNGNGLQDAGEPGIDGVLVQNKITYPDGTITILKTITGDNLATPAVEHGWYWFGNLLQDENYNGVSMTPTPSFEISVLTPAGTGPLTGLAVTQLTVGSDPRIDANNPAGTAASPIKGITDMQPFANPTLQPLPASSDFGYVRRLSLGNLVWFDVNNNGLYDTGESVVPAVKIELLDPVSGNVLQTTFTEASGYYRFDGLFPGDYQARIAAENWTGITGSPGGTLDGTKPLAAANSSTGNATAAQTSGTTAVNGMDHGVDSATPANTGITSLTVTLGAGIQPLNDKDAGASGVGDHGVNGDAYDNLALDFGFYRLSVGNLVFTDNNFDGFFNVGDTGVNGVRVELYSGPTLVAVSTTSGGGNYLFTGQTDVNGAPTGNPLLPGATYTVQLPAGQPVLASFYSTHDTIGTPTPNGGVDNDDNTIGMAPATGLLVTPALTLAAGVGAPAGTVVTATSGLTYQPTIDVGLAPAAALVAFGNLVWLDTNGNGLVDNGETGITNVVVELFQAGQTPGTDTPLRTQTTDADGRFYFDTLPPGSYFSYVPASQFLTGAPLATLFSSPGAGTSAASDETVDENGLDSSTPSVSGISSGVFVLAVGTGPLGENALNYIGLIPDANTTFTVDFGFHVSPCFPDVLPPTITCPPSVAVNCAGDVPPPNFVGGTVADACDPSPVVTHVDQISNLTCASRFILTRTYTATDSYSNSVSCSQTITVNDNTPPVPVAGTIAACYPDVAIAEAAAMAATTTTDNCPGALTKTASTVGDCSAVITVTVTDGCGNAATVTYNTRIDNTPPVITCVPDKTADCGEAWSFDPPEASDTCGSAIVTIVSTLTNSGAGGAYTATRTWIATDTCGNSAQCSQTVLVKPCFSLGNRVFADDGAGGGTANNGLQDGTEPGIEGVVVNLYAADVDGQPTGNLLDTQTTDADGWYRFDGLPAGRYVAVVDVTGSGAALNGLMNSTGASTDFTLTGDRADHGLDSPLGGASVLPGGIASAAVTLGANLQPLGEAMSTGAGAHGPTGDAGDNLVVDFGFTCATYVDGYAFEDFTRDGQWKPNNDVPLPGITVWVTNSQGGVVSVLTDSNGYYRANVPVGSTTVLVDTNSAGFPPGLVLTDNTFGQGENPTTVNVPPCGSARDNTGYRKSAPTLASLLSLTAHAAAGEVTVNWVTLAEFGTVAYDLQRQLPDGSWTIVNANPVFAWNSSIGASYSVVDAGARARQTYRYQVTEYLDSGETKVHGPFEVTVTGAPGVPVQVTSVAVAAGQLRLTWPGGARAYTVERSQSLSADAEWTEVPLPAPGATSVVVPMDGATGFFRVFRVE